MIIKNYFFLIAGIMAVFFSIGHAIWGQRHILGDVQTSKMSLFTKHMLLVIWHQPTIFHFLAAVALIMAAVSTAQALNAPLVIFIAVVSFGFFLNYVGASLIKNRSLLPKIVPQTIALILYLGIIVAGLNR